MTDDEIPPLLDRREPSTLREMFDATLSELLAGRAWCGWHESGTYAFGNADDPVPDGVTLLGPDDPDMLILTGAIVTTIVNRVKQGPELIIPKNRAQRRAEGRHRLV